MGELYRKKLVRVAYLLEAVNAPSARQTKIWNHRD